MNHKALFYLHFVYMYIKSRPVTKMFYRDRNVGGGYPK